LSDNGSQFTSEMMRDVASILGIHLVFTPHYRSEANGTVERLRQTFTAMVKKLVNDSPTGSYLFPFTITYAYNSSVHETTKATPFAVVLELYLLPYWTAFMLLRVLLKIVLSGESP
jgi:transposase InsO family protein